MPEPSAKWLIIGGITLAGIGLAAHHVGKQYGSFPDKEKYKGWEWRVYCIDACRAWRAQVREPGEAKWDNVAIYPYTTTAEKRAQRKNAIEGAKTAIDAEVGA